MGKIILIIVAIAVLAKPLLRLFQWLLDAIQWLFEFFDSAKDAGRRAKDAVQSATTGKSRTQPSRSKQDKEIAQNLQKHLDALPARAQDVPDTIEALDKYTKSASWALKQFFLNGLKGDRTRCPDIERLEQDLSNFFVVAQRFVRAFEGPGSHKDTTVYAECYNRLALCYARGLGTEKDPAQADQCRVNYWLAYFASDLSADFARPVPCYNHGLELFQAFSADLMKLPALRREYEKLEQLLLARCTARTSRAARICACLLMELYSLRDMGAFADRSNEELAALQAEAVKAHDLYAIFRQKPSYDDAARMGHSALVMVDFPEKQFRNQEHLNKCVAAKKRLGETGFLAERLLAEMRQEREDYLAPFRAQQQAEEDRERQAQLEKQAEEQSGILYREGLNQCTAALTDLDMEQGKTKLRKAAQLGSAAAAEALVNFAAEEGDSNAQCLMGELYLYGAQGKPKDAGTAFGWFGKAARQRHAKATFYLAQFAQEGWMGIKDPAQAATLYQRAADLGDVGAMVQMTGTLLGEGQVDKAEALFLKAGYTDPTDDRDKSYVLTAIKALINLRLPENGQPNDTTHDTYCHLLHYVRLKLDEFNEAIKKQYVPTAVNDYLLSPECLDRAKCGDMAAMSLISSALSDEAFALRRAADLEKIRLLLPEAKNGFDSELYHQLYTLYAKDPRTHRQAADWVHRAVGNGDARAMMSVWYDSYGVFGYDYNERYDYLCRARDAGSQAAETELEYMERLREDEERKARMRREQMERAQAELRASRREAIERDVDILFGGSGHTMEEKMYMGRISFVDYLRYEEFVNK